MKVAEDISGWKSRESFSLEISKCYSFIDGVWSHKIRQSMFRGWRHEEEFSKKTKKEWPEMEEQNFQ